METIQQIQKRIDDQRKQAFHLIVEALDSNVTDELKLLMIEQIFEDCKTSIRGKIRSRSTLG